MSIVPYRPKVYNKEGVLLEGKWTNPTNSEDLPDGKDWSLEYSKFTRNPLLSGDPVALDTDYVLVHYNKPIQGGNGIDKVVSKIWKVDFNGQEASFVSFDDRLQEGSTQTGRVVPIVKNYQVQEQYFAYDQDVLAAARVVEFDISSSDMGINKEYVFDDSVFSGRKIMGILHSDQKIISIDKDNNGRIVVKFDKQAKTRVKLSLDGYLLKYKSNSRTLVSEFMVAKTIKYTLMNDVVQNQEIKIPARNIGENIGVVK
jgi:hypothetical protein